MYAGYEVYIWFSTRVGDVVRHTHMHIMTAICSTAEAPPSLWLDSAETRFEICADRLITVPLIPPAQTDILLPTLEQRLAFIEAAMTQAESKRAVVPVAASLSRDELCAVVAFTMQSPYPMYLLLNAWMQADRKYLNAWMHYIAPMARLLVTALMKLPKVTVPAGRAVRVGAHSPMLQAVFEDPQTKLPANCPVNFFSFSSFTMDDQVLDRPFFATGQTVLYIYARRCLEWISTVGVPDGT